MAGSGTCKALTRVEEQVLGDSLVHTVNDTQSRKHCGDHVHPGQPVMGINSDVPVSDISVLSVIANGTHKPVAPVSQRQGAGSYSFALRPCTWGIEPITPLMVIVPWQDRSPTMVSLEPEEEELDYTGEASGTQCYNDLSLVMPPKSPETKTATEANLLRRPSGHALMRMSDIWDFSLPHGRSRTFRGSFLYIIAVQLWIHPYAVVGYHYAGSYYSYLKVHGIRVIADLHGGDLDNPTAVSELEEIKDKV
ncbi:hypothetical protein JOM56_014356 [Amanita muscaria]